MYFTKHAKFAQCFLVPFFEHRSSGVSSPVAFGKLGSFKCALDHDTEFFFVEPRRTVRTLAFDAPLPEPLDYSKFFDVHNDRRLTG